VPDARVGMAALSLCPHGGRWFDGHNLMAACGQPSRVAPGASANIENQSRSVGQRAEQPGVDGFESDTLISGRDGQGVVFVLRY